MSKKECTTCYEVKDLSDFDKRVYTSKKTGNKTISHRHHCKTCRKVENNKRYRDNPETKKAHNRASYKHRIKKYGLEIQEYEEMLESQNHRCYVCRVKPKRKLNIDHNHKTGKVRKLLCPSCNTALGHARDNVTILQGLIDYVIEHNE
jgi:hypothetical protein